MLAYNYLGIAIDSFATPVTTLIGRGSITIRDSLGNTIITGLASGGAPDPTKENVLGNPASNGQVLSSTTAGVRSWITPAAGAADTTNLRRDINANALTIANKLIPQSNLKLLWGDFNSFGNSITEGCCTTDPQNIYVTFFGRLSGFIPHNFGKSGAGMKEMTVTYYRNTASTHSTVPATVSIGTNNLRLSTSVSRYENLKNGINNIIVNQFIDTVVAASAGMITRSSGWSVLTTTDTLQSKSILKSLGTPLQSSTAGSTLSFTWFGDNIYILTYGADISHNFGSFKVTIDGVDKLFWDANGKADDWFYNVLGNYNFRTAAAIGISNIGAGNHNVVITCLSNNEIDIDAICRLMQPSGCASIQIGHVLKSTPKGYAFGPSQSSDAAVNITNAKIDTVVTYYQNLGYPVCVAKVENFVNLNTDFIGNSNDGLHPNDSGHVHMAQAFYYNLEKTTASGTNTSQVLTDATNIVFNSLSGRFATVTLGGNRAISITNLNEGNTLKLVVIQDGTGSRSLTLSDAVYVQNGAAGVVALSTAGGSVDVLTFSKINGKIYCNLDKNYTAQPVVRNLVLGYDSALAAYSVRKVGSIYSGYCMRIVRNSDFTSQDIGFSGGIVDTAAIKSFAGSNIAYVSTWYDQSGNGRDAVQTNSSFWPIIVNYGVLQLKNGKPAIAFDGTRQTQFNTYFFAYPSANWSYAMVGSLTSTSANNSFGSDGDAYQNNGMFLQNSYVVFNKAGVATTIGFNSIASGTLSALSMRYFQDNTAHSYLNTTDYGTQTVGVYTQGASAYYLMGKYGRSNNTSNSLTGFISEHIVYNHSGYNIDSVRTNQISFYGL